LHKHLFTSLFFYALISSLLKWHLLTTSQSGRSSNAWLTSICLLLSILLRYFRSTTYLWMFNEALYLHQLIKNAFTQPPLTPLIVLAYVLPAVTTLSYILIRGLTDGLTISSTDPFVSVGTLSLSLQNVSQSSVNSLDNSYSGEDMSDIVDSQQSSDPYFSNLMEVLDKHTSEDSSLFEEDKCWLMPSPNSWLEWVINAPNLAILIVSQALIGK
jgi:hypothetical protein